LKPAPDKQFVRCYLEKCTTQNGVGRVAKAVKHLPNKHKALLKTQYYD
jgi:hypothetical protein